MIKESVENIRHEWGRMTWLGRFTIFPLHVTLLAICLIGVVIEQCTRNEWIYRKTE